MFGIGNSSSSSKKVNVDDKSKIAAQKGGSAIRGDENEVEITTYDGSQEALDLADSVVAENTAAAETAANAAETINADSLDFAGDALDSQADTSAAAIDEMGRFGGTALGEMGRTSETAMGEMGSLSETAINTVDRGLRTMAERTESATRGALNWASEATRSDSADTMQTVTKWGAGALAVVAVAWALSR